MNKLELIFISLMLLLLGTGARPEQSCYTVQPGDNLSRIARRNGISVDEIVRVNDLTTTVIQPGQQLCFTSSPATTGATNANSGPTSSEQTQGQLIIHNRGWGSLKFSLWGPESLDFELKLGTHIIPLARGTYGWTAYWWIGQPCQLDATESLVVEPVAEITVVQQSVLCLLYFTSSAPATVAQVPQLQTSCPDGCTYRPPGCDIKGNVSFYSKERIYHVPGQQFYDATVINPAYGERWFCTEREAFAAGWRRSHK